MWLDYKKNHSFIKKYPSTKKTISHNLGCLSLIFQVIGFLFTNLKPEMKSHSFFYSFFFILFITLLFFFRVALTLRNPDFLVFLRIPNLKFFLMFVGSHARTNHSFLSCVCGVLMLTPNFEPSIIFLLF